MKDVDKILRALEWAPYQHALEHPPFTDNGDGTCTIHMRLPYSIAKRRETIPEKGDTGKIEGI